MLNHGRSKVDCGEIGNHSKENNEQACNKLFHAGCKSLPVHSARPANRVTGISGKDNCSGVDQTLAAEALLKEKNMRLWHYKLIPYLPDVKTSGHKKLNQLGGQHRECCMMRGNGWGINHSTVNYVWKYSYFTLAVYHVIKVIRELEKRGFNIDIMWKSLKYRGKKLGTQEYSNFSVRNYIDYGEYPEHNDKYLDDCINNLAGKGIIIDKQKVLKNKTREETVTYNWRIINEN